MNSDLPKFITIVGPTASGKTKLSLHIAKKYNGEILCADSRTLYRGLDIATAKPTLAEQALVPHHLLDIATPDNPVNVAEFKQRAESCLRDISRRGKLPIVVGGSGLYVDSILYDYQFPELPSADVIHRHSLMTLDELTQELTVSFPQLAKSIDMKNRRRVIHALQTGKKATSRRDRQLEQSLTIGLGRDQNSSAQVVSTRISDMIASGLIEEIRHVVERYGWDIEPLSGIGYRAFRSYIEGTATLHDAIAAFERGDRQLAKRQITWFKRNQDIHWLSDTKSAYELIAEFALSPNDTYRL